VVYERIIGRITPEDTQASLVVGDISEAETVCQKKLDRYT